MRQLKTVALWIGLPQSLHYKHSVCSKEKKEKKNLNIKANTLQTLSQLALTPANGLENGKCKTQFYAAMTEKGSF